MAYYPKDMDNDSVSLYPNPHIQFKKFNNTQTPNSPQTQEPIISPQKPLLGPDNTVTICQFCQASIKTAVKYTTTTRTHIAAVLCGCICCCCCIPYCSESAKNSDHYCPNCHRYLGTYEK